VAIAEAIYGLHFFQKKAKKGIAIPKKEIDLIRRSLRDAIEHGRQLGHEHQDDQKQR